MVSYGFLCACGDVTVNVFISVSISCKCHPSWTVLGTGRVGSGQIMKFGPACNSKFIKP